MIGNACSAGSRFAELASWLRTSTSGSIAARPFECGRHRPRNRGCIAEEPGRPQPDIPIGMIEQSQSGRLVEPTHQVKRPELLEGTLPGLVSERLLEPRRQRVVLAVGDQSQRRLPRPLVGIGQQVDQCRRAFARQVARLGPCERTDVARHEPVDSAIARLDLSFIVAVVVDLAVVPIGDVERTVGAELDVHRSEPSVAGRDRHGRRRCVCSEDPSGETWLMTT